MQDGTYPTRNFATLGPLTLQPPFTLKHQACNTEQKFFAWRLRPYSAPVSLFAFRANSLLYSLNQAKAHLQSYPYISTLNSTCVRLFSAIGILLSFNLIIPILLWSGIFLYSYRESFHFLTSGIYSVCLCIIISEALLFASFFWGAFHFTLCPNESFFIGIITPSSRILILTITFLLSSASVLTGYAYCIREKSICFLYSNSALLIFLIAATFSSLQTSEFLLLVNDTLYGNILFFLTGLHFFHVIIGMILLFICLWSLPYSFLENSQWAYTSLGIYCQVQVQIEFYSLLYWHFVELLWLFIEFVLYSY